MKKDELRDLMTTMLGKAKNNLSKAGRLTPTGFIIFGNDELAVCPFMFRNQNEKDRELFTFKAIIKDMKSKAAFTIIESWYVEGKLGQPNIVPSQHPDRKECIFVVGECDEGRIILSQRFRRDDKKIIFEELIETKDSIVTFEFGIVGQSDINKAYS